MSMQLRWLGQTGIRVSNLALGTMSFGSMGRTTQDECTAMVDRALEAGINFMDSADVYSGGESEVMLGQALQGRRDDVVIATKFFNRMGKDANRGGSSRRWIMRACEDSLRRLGTDRIDLYQAHRPDTHVDIEETLGALTDLMAQGKVLAIGSSTFPAEDIVEAQWAAERRMLNRFRCEQPPYSIFVRGIERDVLPLCQKYGMGAIVWSPLNSGWLTGKYRAGAAADADSRFARMGRGAWSLDAPGTDRKSALVEELDRLAAEAGTDLITLSIAFTLAHPAVTSCIIGPRTLDQLQSQLGGASFTLTDEILDRIDALVAPGENISRTDIAYEPPVMRHAALRRRA